MKYVSEKLGLPVYTLSTSSSSIKYKKYGIKFADNNSPEAFLSLIKNAKLVFSSSFHGNVFSIIFRKNFFSLYTVEKGERVDDPRLNTLVEKFGLLNTELDINNYKSVDYNRKINYNEDVIMEKIEESRKYLKDAISI